MSDKEFIGLSDDALLSLCKTSDSALEALIRRHFRIVNACARSYFLIGAEESDLIQEGMIGLLSAIRSFHPEEETPFAAYAALCVRRQMISAVRAANANRNAALNGALPLDVFTTGPSGSVEDPEKTYLGKERFDELKECLSPLERKVFAPYLEGLSSREIAQKLDCTVKSVDNAIQRIRAKAKGLYFGR